MRSRGSFSYLGYTVPDSRNWWNYPIRTVKGEMVARVSKVYDGSISKTRLEIEVPEAGKKEDTIQVWRELMKNALVVEAR